MTWFRIPSEIQTFDWTSEHRSGRLSLSKDLRDEIVSTLALDLDLSLTVELDDDAEDHSLIELAGDMLEEILDAREVEGVELGDGFFLSGTLDDALGFELEEALITGLDSIFLTAEVNGDLRILSDKVLLVLEEDDLTASFSVAPEEDKPEDLEDNAGLGTLLRGPANPVALGSCISLPPTVTNIQISFK